MTRVRSEADIDQGAERFKETLSTLIDVVAMVAVAAGVGWGLWSRIGPWSVAAAGLLLFGMSVASSMVRQSSTPAPPVVEAVDADFLPGPEHPGTVHVVGR